MDKTVTQNQKRASKQPKKKKKQQQKQPLKVVYITNPIKFKATASEFRSLVQELTGQDADVPDYSRFSAADGVGEEVAKVAAEGNEEAAEVVAAQKGSDLSTSDEGFCSPEMIDNFEGLAASSLWHGDCHDVFKRLGAM